jgi:glutamate N-acetyltransferase/amino-acid N-acetyltransferase
MVLVYREDLLLTRKRFCAKNFSIEVVLKEIEGGICAPGGFWASGLRAGIKAGAKKRDLALVFSREPCSSAAVFTANRVKAANIIISREHLEKSAGRIRALVANSGNANACTGQAGLAAARRMAGLTALALGVNEVECAVASTGVIGVPLPLAVIEAAIGDLVSSMAAGPESADAALEAIMTTDTRKKQGAVVVDLPSGANPQVKVPVKIGAMVKGSGMIHPNMATMIAVITTDAVISPPMLDRALRRAVNRSFNRLTIDGDTSTNDMALIMANGTAGNRPLDEGSAFEVFAGALEFLCVSLVRKMARDGEGATKLLSINVSGAENEEAAAALAKSVAGSSLVKAACFGADANWGRILCALGYAIFENGGQVPFDGEKASIRFASPAGVLEVFAAGAPLPFSEAEAKKILLEEEITVIISAGSGPGQAEAWGCDLSYDYVKINGDYRT